MNKKLKQLFMTSGLSLGVITPFASIISCSNSTKHSKGNPFDITLAVAPNSTMNFIRYKEAAALYAPTTLPLLETAPPAVIARQLGLRVASMSDANGGVVSNEAITTGSVADDTSRKGLNMRLDSSGKNLEIKIKNGILWSNGSKLVAQNYVDTIKAVFDLNNASEMILEAERFGIKNGVQSYDAQMRFFKTYGYVYPDPFNYKNIDVGSSNNAKYDISMLTEDEEEIKTGKKFPKMLEACLDLGVEADHETKLLIHFDHKESLNFFMNLMVSSVFWPINKDYIDSIGGFDNFGKDQNIISAGAWMVDDFDPQYGVKYVNNPHYLRKDYIIAKTLNFRFITNPNTLDILYRDNRIISTTIPKDFLPIYLSDADLRKETKKTIGTGTVAFFLNHYKDNPNNEVFSNKWFRQALFYGINRKQLLSAFDLDFTNPVGVYTANSSTSSNGESYLSTLKGMEYVTDKGDGTLTKALPMMITPTEARGFAYQTDFIPREDTLFKPELAKSLLERAKKEIGQDKFPIKLRMPYVVSDPKSKSLSVVLQDYLNRVFGNDIILDPQALPVLVYQNFASSGNWDLMIKQVDPLKNSPWDFLGEFVNGDAPNPKEGKTIGYIKNQAGDFTYQDYFKSMSGQDITDFIANYKIKNNWVYDIARWFTTHEEVDDIVNNKYPWLKGSFLRDSLIPQGEALKAGNKLDLYELRLLDDLKEYLGLTWNAIDQAFLQVKNDSDEYKVQEAIDAVERSKSAFVESTVDRVTGYHTYFNVLDKVQRDMVPCIPVAEADNKWVATRSKGSYSNPHGYFVDPAYIYDATNRPYSWLEGIDSVGK